MARFPGFCGGTYTAQSSWLDSERCMNLIPEVSEAPGAKSTAALYPAPGLTLFCDIGAALSATGTIRASLEINGRCFYVFADRFVELSAAGTVLGNYGAIANDGQPASLSSSQTQIFIVSGGLCYSFDLTSNALAQITVISDITPFTIAASPDGLQITRAQQAIVAISQVGKIVTVTLAEEVTAHVGQTVYISDVSPAGFNGTFPILSVSGKTFTYSNTTTGLVGWATGYASKGATLNVPILSLTWADNIVTGVTATPLDPTGDATLTITGCSVTGHNGTFALIGPPSSTTFERDCAVTLSRSYRPSTFSGDCSNPSGAYDSDADSYATIEAAANYGDPPDEQQAVFSGLPAVTALSGLLVVGSKVYATAATGTSHAAKFEASWDNGATWTQLYNLTTTTATPPSALALPANQDISHIQVRAKCSAATSNKSSATVSQDVYDVRVDATIDGGAKPVDDVAGGTGTAYSLQIILDAASVDAGIPAKGQDVVIDSADVISYNNTWTVAAAAKVNAGGTSNWYIFCDVTEDYYPTDAGGGGTMTTQGPTPVTALIGAYCDGYFIRLLPDSQKWGTSQLLDCTTWDLTDVALVSVFPDNVVSVVADHREVWIFGRSKTQVYYDSGNVFPFDVVSSGYIEQGCCAIASPCRLDNSIFWLGRDERGGVMAWRANGYQPQRVSTHGVEYAWQQYATVADAVSWSYQENGHTFWVLTFPTANATWVFDASTGMWHERGSWTGTSYNAHLGICHAYAFGKHLIGSRADGKVYQMSSSYADDAGRPIRWLRRTPYVADQQQRMQHTRFQLDVEAGLGPGTPSCTVRWSDDGGHNYTSEQTLSAGAAGAYTTRLIARRLGSSRGRIYEAAGLTPLKVVDAYLDVAE